MKQGGAEALEAVEGVVQGWIDAVSQQDGAAMGQLFTEDTHFFLDGKELEGREAVQMFLQEGFDAGWAEASVSVTESSLLGDTAYSVGTYASKNGQGEIFTEGNWMAIYKQEGGAWKFYRLMETSKP